jgi:cell division protein FtsN
MSNPHDIDPRRADLPRRPDLEAPSSGGSMWAWLAALVVILVILGMVVGYNRTERASNNQSNPPTTTGAAPSEPRPAPPANSGGNASQPAPATPAPSAPAPNEGPR